MAFLLWGSKITNWPVLQSYVKKCDHHSDSGAKLLKLAKELFKEQKTFLKNTFGSDEEKKKTGL